MAFGTHTEIKELFNAQREALDNFFDSLEYNQVEKLLDVCLTCTGSILVTGVGKSGIIAQKISSTFLSIGVKSAFLSPLDSLHGDLGMVYEGDVLLCLSKSGSSTELLSIIPHVKRKGARTVAVTCSGTSTLDEQCDMSICLPLKRELCPFDLAPVTSCAIQLIFGDTLALAIMYKRGLTKSEYALNHPSGRIGRRLLMRVSDVMLQDDKFPSAFSGSHLFDGLLELSSKGTGCLVVKSSDGALKGVITDGDVRRAVLDRKGHIGDVIIDEIMSNSPRRCLPTLLAVEALELMQGRGKRITAMPVVDENDKVVGLITLASLIASGL